MDCIKKCALLVMVAALLGACGSEKKTPDTSKDPSAAKVEKTVSSKKSKGPAPVLPDPDWALKGKPEKVALSNILISYKGAVRAPKEIKRTKEQAEARAKEVYAKIADGDDFGKLATEFSDGPEKELRGRLGVIMSNRLPPPMDKEIIALKVGEISKPFESPFGFHVLRRDKVEEMFLAQIVISYKGAKSSPKNVERSKAEAQALADEAYKSITKDNTPFGDAVAKYSDLAPMSKGGFVGQISKGLLDDPLDSAAFALEVDEVSKPVETENGYYILKKLREINARHILVAHNEVAEKTKRANRTKAEAKAYAEGIYKEIFDGSDFKMLAMAKSDCPSKSKGGHLGSLAEGIMPPEFDKAAFALKPGETSKIVESDFGFHIIQRIE